MGNSTKRGEKLRRVKCGGCCFVGTCLWVKRNTYVKSNELKIQVGEYYNMITVKRQRICYLIS